MVGALTLVGLMLGERFIAHTTIRIVDAELSVYLAFGAPQKIQEIMQNRFVA
jgi:hypothetical protein